MFALPSCVVLTVLLAAAPGLEPPPVLTGPAGEEVATEPVLADEASFSGAELVEEVSAGAAQKTAETNPTPTETAIEVPVIDCVAGCRVTAPLEPSSERVTIANRCFAVRLASPVVKGAKVEAYFGQHRLVGDPSKDGQTEFHFQGHLPAGRYDLMVVVCPQEGPGLSSAPVPVYFSPVAATLSTDIICERPFAFQTLSLTARIEEGAPTGNQGNDEIGERRGKKACEKSYTFRFHQPAHFPRAEYARFGQELTTEGLVIAEGMEVSFYADGTFEVAFNALSPSVPVQVRLQLLVQDCDDQTYTLTLPPFEFRPAELPIEQVNGRVVGQQAYHQGWSQLVKNWSGQIKGVGRRGTAKFGFGQLYSESNGFNVTGF